VPPPTAEERHRLRMCKVTEERGSRLRKVLHKWARGMERDLDWETSTDAPAHGFIVKTRKIQNRIKLHLNIHEWARFARFNPTLTTGDRGLVLSRLPVRPVSTTEFILPYGVLAHNGGAFEVGIWDLRGTISALGVQSEWTTYTPIGPVNTRNLEKVHGS